MGQFLMPLPAVVAAQLYVHNVFVTGPGFIEEEPVVAIWVAMQNRLDERAFVPHRVEHSVEALEKGSGPPRLHFEEDGIGDGFYRSCRVKKVLIGGQYRRGPNQGR